jgi:hypothetical protein
MIAFVVYFSTAQDEIGSVVVDDHGAAAAHGIGGPALHAGTYRVEEGRLTQIEPVRANMASQPDAQAISRC